MAFQVSTTMQSRAILNDRGACQMVNAPEKRDDRERPEDVVSRARNRVQEKASSGSQSCQTRIIAWYREGIEWVDIFHDFLQ